MTDRLRVPRKIKKRTKKLLKTVEIIAPAETMYLRPIVKPFLFCPWCGCVRYKGTGNLTAYPEHWEYFRCARCEAVVGYIDNSPFIHALECNYNNYNPVF